MEEVWKDISDEVDLPRRHHQNHHHPMILKDFFGKDLTTSAVVSPPPPHPPTVLALSSAARGGSMFLHQSPRDYYNHCDDDRHRLHSTCANNYQQRPISHVAQDIAGNKRLWSRDVGGNNNTTVVDRRHERMVKNRESAARSRARKQAYTKELELEVAHLMEENTRLKEQQQQVEIATAGSSKQLEKKKSLRRSSTAPF